MLNLGLMTLSAVLSKMKCELNVLCVRQSLNSFHVMVFFHDKLRLYLISGTGIRLIKKDGLSLPFP